jgi:hypothetical protein
LELRHCEIKKAVDFLALRDSTNRIIPIVDASQRQARAFQALRVQSECRCAIPTIGRDQSRNNVSSKQRFSSGGRPRNDEALDADAVNDLVSSRQSLSHTVFRHTTPQGPDLHFQFRKRILESVRHLQSPTA